MDHTESRRVQFARNYLELFDLFERNAIDVWMDEHTVHRALDEAAIESPDNLEHRVFPHKLVTALRMADSNGEDRMQAAVTLEADRRGVEVDEINLKLHDAGALKTLFGLTSLTLGSDRHSMVPVGPYLATAGLASAASRFPADAFPSALVNAINMELDSCPVQGHHTMASPDAVGVIKHLLQSIPTWPIMPRSVAHFWRTSGLPDETCPSAPITASDLINKIENAW